MTYQKGKNFYYYLLPYVTMAMWEKVELSEQFLVWNSKLNTVYTVINIVILTFWTNHKDPFNGLESTRKWLQLWC